MTSSARPSTIPMTEQEEVTDHQEFHTLCGELYQKLLERMRCNVAGENFMPRTAPYEVLDSQIAQVSRLLVLTTAKIRKSLSSVLQDSPDPDAGDSMHRIELDQWLGNIAKRPGHVSPRREQRVATVLAVLLEVHASLSSEPTSEAWQAFTASCMRYETHAELRDGHLPLSRRSLCNLLGRPHGLLFYATQFDYCSPVVKKYTRLDMRNRRSDTPLPYLSETLIGSGAYGDVFMVEIAEGHILTVPRGSTDKYYSENVEYYARKDIIIRSTKEDASLEEWDVIQLIRERQNRHAWEQHLMQTFACFHFSDKISLFMRLAERGNLAEFMSEEARPFEPSNRRYLAKVVDIASALAYLHHYVKHNDGSTVTCFHLDLKPENILVVLEAESEELVFKLADFSISRIKEMSTSKVTNLTSTYARSAEQDAPHAAGKPMILTTKSRLGDASSCIAPEGLFGGRVSEKSDVWGYGCVLAIFISWLCEGPTGVQDFMNERVLQSDSQHDRFFIAEATHQHQCSVSAAVHDWLQELCAQTSASEQTTIYRDVCVYLLQSLLCVSADDREDMIQVHRALTGIASGAITKQKPIKLTPPQSSLEAEEDSSAPSENGSTGSDVAQPPVSSDVDLKIVCRVHPQPALDMNERHGPMDHLDVAGFRQVHCSPDHRLIVLEFADRVEVARTSHNGSWEQRMTLTAGAHPIQRVFVSASYIYIVPHCPTFKLFCFPIRKLFTFTHARAYIVEGNVAQPDHLLVDIQTEDVLLACYSADHRYLALSSHVVSLELPTSRASLLTLDRMATYTILTYRNIKRSANAKRFLAAGLYTMHLIGGQLFISQKDPDVNGTIALGYYILDNQFGECCWPHRLMRWRDTSPEPWQLPDPFEKLSVGLDYTFEALSRLAILLSVDVGIIVDQMFTLNAPYDIMLLRLRDDQTNGLHLLLVVGTRLYVLHRREAPETTEIVMVSAEKWPSLQVEYTRSILSLPMSLDQARVLVLSTASSRKDIPRLILVDDAGRMSPASLQQE